MSKAVEKSEKKTDWDKVNPNIQYQGNQITLPVDPEKMPLREAVKALQRLAEDEERLMDVVEIIDSYPLDAAVALMRAIQQKYGWASPVPTQGFFGPEPPRMLMVKTGPEETDTIQVPWGAFKLPNVENPVETHYHRHQGRFVLLIKGSIRKKHVHILKELCDLTRQILVQTSIYKGKAVRLEQDSEGLVDLMTPPAFLHTKHIRREELILTDVTQSLVTVNLFTPILHTQACRDYGIPLKRGVLLEGPYGTGKSMISAIVSQLCVENGWTFVLIGRASGLAMALEFARRYEPAVVFAEDIDRVLEERDEDANEILNVLDGVLSKGSEIMVVLTSNFPEKIDRAMLRPGRLDAVIQIEAPDAKAVQKLIRLYARDRIEPETDLTEVGETLAGQIPATIREVVERSKLAMIARGGQHIVNGQDLLVAANGMVRHLGLLNSSKIEKRQTAEEKLAGAIGELMASVVEPIAEADGYQTRHTLGNAIHSSHQTTRSVRGQVSGFEEKTGKKLTEIDEDVKKIKRKVGG